MSITEQELASACRTAAREMVFSDIGWLSQVKEVTSSLKSSKLIDLPVVYQKMAILNAINLAADIASQPRKMPGFYEVLVKALQLPIKDISNRLNSHIQNLEGFLKTEYTNVKSDLMSSLDKSLTEMFSDDANSFLNQAIVQGVLYVGKQRLDKIENIRVAEIYCQLLFQTSGIFDINESSEAGLDSVAATIKKSYQIMATRLQEIYIAVYQPTGLGQIVYSLPGPSRIMRCIMKFEEQLCRGKNNTETIANGHIRIKNGINILLITAWYLEVDRSDGIIIQVMKNPGILMGSRLKTAAANNILWHLDELVDVKNEQIAWQETLRSAA